jgi:putative sterol carrier protein
MIDGELDGTAAFMTGKLKIEGDMGIAMKLQSVLKG